MIQTSKEAQTQALVFTHDGASKEELRINGECFILNLCGVQRYSNLNEARYFMFTKMTRRSKLRSNFDLAKLPPTSEAAHEHLFRVYLQVQAWLGNILDATEWGWKMEYVKESGGSRKTLTAVPSSKPFTPDDDLHLISCSCKSSCGNYCGCRKVRLNCSTMCEKKTNGISCDNSPAFDDVTDVDDNE